MKGIVKGYDRLPPIMKGYERCNKMLRIWRKNSLKRVLSLCCTCTSVFSKSRFAQVSSIGRLLFNRPVDRSRSISTVDKDSPT